MTENSSSPPASYPNMIGQWEVVRRLGVGGQGTTLLVRHTKHIQSVPFRVHACLKLLLPEHTSDLGIRRAFCDEARLTGKFHHSHIAGAIDAGSQDGLLYLVTPFIDGCDLDVLCWFYRAMAQAQEAPYAFPIEFALHIAVGLASALDYLHDFVLDGRPVNVIHRDLKPSNVMLDQAGLPVLIDFGTARALIHAHKTRQGDIKGSLRYLSPEQASLGPVDRRADLWALGVLLYETLTGTSPFPEDGKTAADLIAAILHAPPPDPREVRQDVPADLAELILALLAKDPAHRPQDASDVLSALGQFALPATTSCRLGLAVSEARSYRRESDDDHQPSHSQTRTAPQAPLTGDLKAPPASFALPADVRTTGGPKARRTRRGRRVAALAAISLGAASASWLLSRPPPPPPLPIATPAAQALKSAPAASLQVPEQEQQVALPLPRQATSTTPPPVPKEPNRSQPAATPAGTPPRARQQGASRARATTGELAIRVHDWAYVWVDGRYLGRSPQDVTLTAGKHTIELSQSQDQSSEVFREEIVVRAGASASKAYRFGQPLFDLDGP